MNKLEVNTDKVFLDFKSHFEIEGNSKIIFSSKYGTGKSYFINEFFNEKSNADNYNRFIISPVNYVVSSNEDIFDLIKIDLIKQLYLFQAINFDEIAKKTSSFGMMKKYIKQNPLQVVRNVSSCLSKVSGVSEALSGISESVITMIEDFEKFDKKVRGEEITDGKKLLNYAESFIDSKNSYLEHNFITQLIFAQLTKLKSQAKKVKQNVLIIEDFDRLDPAHIFRILNIFSAHNTESDNKFGFDKVIIVCDLKNIELLYEHLYGKGIDFDGYIDKFYSFSPYFFDNTKAIHYYIKNNFKLPIDDYAINAFTHLLQAFDAFDTNSRIRLRKFNKSTSQNLNENKCIISYDCTHYVNQFKDYATFPINANVKSIELYSNDVPLITIVKFLKNLYGGFENLLKIIRVKKDSIGRMDSETSLNYLKLLAIPTHMCSSSSNYYKLFFKSTDSYDHPELTLHTGKLKLITRWNINEKYSSDSYYERMTMHYIANNDYLMDFKSVLDNLENFINIGINRDWFN